MEHRLHQARYRKTQKGSATQKRYYTSDAKKANNRRWQSNNLKKHLAHQKLYEAVLRGIITREICKECGELKTEAHHPDYDKPYDVIWLCNKHHNLYHNKF